MASCDLPAEAIVMDPWNGAGTTTSSAVLNGYGALGFDLNPVMTVVAKAKFLHGEDFENLTGASAEILAKAARCGLPGNTDDPLLTWLSPTAAIAVRKIERTIYANAVSKAECAAAVDSVQSFSSFAAALYLALFRTVRDLLRGFVPSNPTWIMRPPRRLRLKKGEIERHFCHCLSKMLSSVLTPSHEWAYASANVSIGVSSSESLPVRSGSVDFVLASPPYCTRIDYAIATSPELAILGFPITTALRDLRGRLIGTPTVHRATISPELKWGKTCTSLLALIYGHPSKAARSYYYKTYTQYFSAMAKSLTEISRCLRPGGRCFLVVQDSYFKDLRVDLAKIFSEMAVKAELKKARQTDFQTSRTLLNVNTRSRKYRKSSRATESVLCFVK